MAEDQICACAKLECFEVEWCAAIVLDVADYSHFEGGGHFTLLCKAAVQARLSHVVGFPSHHDL